MTAPRIPPPARPSPLAEAGTSKAVRKSCTNVAASAVRAAGRDAKPDLPRDARGVAARR